MSTYVLVHGSFHGAWCWTKVVPLLEAAGHGVITPTLTGMGERAQLLGPDIGLTTHVDDVVAAIEEAHAHDVVLVGHSYGAMVITGVADRIPERIAHLVYLDTFVPRDGEAVADVAPLVGRGFRRQARLHGDGWRIDPPAEQFGRKGLYGVTKEPDLSWVKRLQTPVPLKTLMEPLHLRDPDIVSRFPRTHICCVGGGRFYALLRSLLGRRTLPPTDPGWQLRQLQTGHDCMITMPRELSDLLLEIPVTPSDRKTGFQPLGAGSKSR